MDDVLKYTKKYSKILFKTIKVTLFPPKPQPPVELAFMTCIIKTDIYTPGWQKAIMKVLRSTKGVRNFRMDENGTVEVSGMVNPNLLLKMLAKGGKLAQLCWLQYGQCSSNLSIHERLNGYGNGYGYGYEYGGNNGCYSNNNDGAFLQSGRFVSRPQFENPYTSCHHGGSNMAQDHNH